MGNFLADFYSVNGLVLESRKRREHLSEEDILRNKAIMESLSKGGNLIEQNFEVSPPSICHLSRVMELTEKRLWAENRIYSSKRHHTLCDGAQWSVTTQTSYHRLLLETFVFL